MERLFVPDGFEVPVGFDGAGFRLEPLGPQHNDADYRAWTSSIEHIRATPGYGPQRDWPTPMTLEDNLADLEMHARHFAAREGFTYSILDGDTVIGCLYIYPADDAEHDASIRSWVTAQRAEMDAVVYREVTRWLAEVWPFWAPAYAARD